MDTTIDQQVARDEAFVPHAKRLRIGRSNFCLLLDIKSKESTLQLVYDVLRRLHSSRLSWSPQMFQKPICRNSGQQPLEMLHICPRLPHQLFVEPPFEEEILAFLCFLRHSAVIRKLTDVNINKLHHPWRAFATVINKCLTEKSSGYENLRLSQAQILWGLYHKRNIDFAYLMWEELAYQVEHKDTKKSNKMYYPRFTKVIIHHFMSKDPSIPRRNKFGALLPIELTNEDIRNSNAYKEYYAVAIGATPPKPKASVRKTRSSSDTTIIPPTAAAGPRLTTSEKGKHAAKASKAKSLSALSEVAMTEAQHLKLATKRSLQQTHISQASGSGVNEGSEKPKKGQNRIKTRQKQEAWRSWEKLEAVTVDRCQPMNQDSYNSNSLGFDQPQPPQYPVIHQPPQELSIQEMEDLKQQYLDELKRLSNLEYHDEIKIAELTDNFNGMSIEIQKKEKLLQEEQWAYLSTHPSKCLHSFCFDDDDEDYTSAITPDEPVLSTEEPDKSLSMRDEHLDTILATESDEFIKSGVEDLIPIPSESEGIPEHVCDVPSHDNSPPLDVLKDQIEDFSKSNEEFSSIDDDSFSIDDIDYVEASPPDPELVSSEVMQIVIPEVEGIDDDILLTINHDDLREKLLNVNHSIFIVYS
nr:hypothetical protein [Tanacetum cinerariifolium]